MPQKKATAPFTASIKTKLAHHGVAASSTPDISIGAMISTFFTRTLELATHTLTPLVSIVQTVKGSLSRMYADWVYGSSSISVLTNQDSVIYTVLAHICFDQAGPGEWYGQYPDNCLYFPRSVLVPIWAVWSYEPRWTFQTWKWMHDQGASKTRDRI